MQITVVVPILPGLVFVASLVSVFIAQRWFSPALPNNRIEEILARKDEGR